MTIHERIKAALAKSGIPAKEIEVYGSQIVITTLGHDTATKWAHLIGQFAKVRCIVDAWDEAKVNKKTSLNPSMVKVCRVFATI